MNGLKDALIITKRQLLQLSRVPEVLIFNTIQPVMFVLLFRYVFGGLGAGIKGGYVQLLMPGIFVQTVTFTLAATAQGLAQDMEKGLIDRFRSLPIARSALVVGRTLGDGLLNIVVLIVMGIAGYIVGWRPTSGAFHIFLGFLMLLFFGYALSWAGIFAGLMSKDARVVAMPRALQYFAEWNPVSTMVAAARQLFGFHNVFGVTAHSFPSEHPIVASLIYMVLIMAIFIPLSVNRYKNANRR
jgi:ABC-2 type transport system permease protein